MVLDLDDLISLQYLLGLFSCLSLLWMYCWWHLYFPYCTLIVRCQASLIRGVRASHKKYCMGGRNVSRKQAKSIDMQASVFMNSTGTVWYAMISLLRVYESEACQEESRVPYIFMYDEAFSLSPHPANLQMKIYMHNYRVKEFEPLGQRSGL